MAQNVVAKHFFYFSRVGLYIEMKTLSEIIFIMPNKMAAKIEFSKYHNRVTHNEIGTFATNG